MAFSIHSFSAPSSPRRPSRPEYPTPQANNTVKGAPKRPRLALEIKSEDSRSFGRSTPSDSALDSPTLRNTLRNAWQPSSEQKPISVPPLSQELGPTGIPIQKTKPRSILRPSPNSKPTHHRHVSYSSYLTEEITTQIYVQTHLDLYHEPNPIPTEEVGGLDSDENNEAALSTPVRGQWKPRQWRWTLGSDGA